MVFKSCASRSAPVIAFPAFTVDGIARARHDSLQAVDRCLRCRV